MSLSSVHKSSSLKYPAWPCKQKSRFLRTELAYLKAIKKKKKKKSNNYHGCQSSTRYAWNSFLATPHRSSHHLSTSQHPHLLQSPPTSYTFAEQRRCCFMAVRSHTKQFSRRCWWSQSGAASGTALHDPKRLFSSSETSHSSTSAPPAHPTISLLLRLR